MENQHREFEIGLTVLVAVAALVFLIVGFGKGTSLHFGDEYSIRVRFERTPGISRKSPVYKNGVQIGRVGKVELVDNDREVEITVMLPKSRKIYTDEECRVRQTVIMGDASLEFVRKSNFSGKVQIIDPDIPLVGGAPSDLLSGFANMEGDLTKAINSVSDAAGHMSEFLGRANDFIGTTEELTDRKIMLDNIGQEMRLTMESTRKLTDNANLFINDLKLQDDIKTIIETMPDVLQKSQTLVVESNQFVKEARVMLERGGKSLDKIDAGMDKIDAGIDKAADALDKASKALDNIIAMTDSLQGDVGEFMGSMKSSAKKLESLFDEVTTIIQAVQNADGTFKRIMRSPEMYEKLMDTLDNIQQITGQVDQMLKTDVKPIAHNVKIITDKVARDPSVFIRNLIRKQPRTKGHLPIWGDGLGSDEMDDSYSPDGFIARSLYQNIEYYEEGDGLIEEYAGCRPKTQGAAKTSWFAGLFNFGRSRSGGKTGGVCTADSFGSYAGDYSSEIHPDALRSNDAIPVSIIPDTEILDTPTLDGTIYDEPAFDGMSPDEILYDGPMFGAPTLGSPIPDATSHSAPTPTSSSTTPSSASDLPKTPREDLPGNLQDVPQNTMPSDIPSPDGPADKPGQPKRPSIGTPTFAPGDPFKTGAVRITPPKTPRKQFSSPDLSSAGLPSRTLLPKPPTAKMTLPALPAFASKRHTMQQKPDTDVYVANHALDEERKNESTDIALNPPQTKASAGRPDAELANTEQAARPDFAQQNEEEGQIICVDPRYLNLENRVMENPIVHSQTAVVAENPQLRFAR